MKLRDSSLWGESAVLHFLNLTWYMFAFVRVLERDTLLQTLLVAITRRSQHPPGLLSPYYGVEHAVRRLTGTLKDPILERFDGGSHTLEALVALAARSGLRRPLEKLWRRISPPQFYYFVPSEPWQAYLWRTGHGTLAHHFPNQRQTWTNLEEAAANRGAVRSPSASRCTGIASVVPPCLSAQAVSSNSNSPRHAHRGRQDVALPALSSMGQVERVSSKRLSGSSASECTEALRNPGHARYDPAARGRAERRAHGVAGVASTTS